MFLPEMRDNLYIDLGDPTAAQWAPDELNRAIDRAVDDLSRVMPREGIYDLTLSFEVADEAWTASHDVAVSLANKWIKWNSETVTDDAGTACARDTDYTMDYANGTITALSTSAIITDTEVCAISYTKSKIALDLSGITDLMRISSVEYPYGEVPQPKIGSSMWNDWLIVESVVTGMETRPSQDIMSAGDHIWVYYKYKHTAPTETANGTYEGYLDNVVLKGAVAYALWMLGSKQDHLAKAQLAYVIAQTTLIGTSLASAVAELGYVDTALDEVATIASPSASEVETDLDSIDGSATAPFEEAVALLNALEADQAIWTDWQHRIEGDGANIKGADWHLQNAQGEGKINAVTAGSQVAAMYAQYSAQELAIAAEWRMKAQTLAAMVAQRLATGQLRIAQAQTRLGQATTFINEAAQRLATAAAYHSEADRRLAMITNHLAAAVRYMELADRYKSEGSSKWVEFMNILRDRAQLLIKRAGSAVKQYA